jgi:hypothetical protein
LRVPDAVLDPAAGGIAHTVRHIGRDHPQYERLKRLAVPEDDEDQPADSYRQAELDRFLDSHQSEGEAMLHLLQRQVEQSTNQRRRAS